MRTVLTVVGCLVAAGAAVGQQPAKRPAGLDVVPADGFAFVSVNVAKLWEAEAFKQLRDALSKGEGAPLATAEKHLGLTAAEIDRVTLIWSRFPSGFAGEQPVIVVTARKPYNEAKVLKALEAESLDEGRHDHMPASPAFPPGGIKKAPAQFDKSYPKELLPHLEKKELLPFDGKFPIDPKSPIKKYQAPSDPLPPETAPPPKKEQDEPDFCQGQPGSDADGDSRTPDLFYSPRARMVVFLLDDRTLVFLPSMGDRHHDSDQQLGLLTLLMRKKATGALADALAVADKHAVVAGLDFRPVRASMMGRGELPRDLVPFRSLIKVSRATATLDLGATATASVALTFASDEDAKRAEPVLKTVFQVAVDELAATRKKLPKEDEATAVVGPLLDLLVASLDKADVKLDSAKLTASATAELGAVVEKALLAMPKLVAQASGQAISQNNLKQIGIALHSFHDAMGYWPHDIVDKAGKPILSWRVQILPFLEQDNLYRSFDLTKAWDDPANAAAVATKLKVFEVPGREVKGAYTFYQMFSADKPLNGGSPVLLAGQKRRVADITDGLSNTFGVVEAAEAVHWAKPGDIPFDPKKLPALGDPKTGKFSVLMMDGAVRTIRRDKITDDELRAFITANGGEVNTFEWKK